MAPHKTKAIILKINPFRESSCIMYLLTPDHGLVHGVAKGVKRKKACAPALERGFLIETLLYSRPQRDLHTVGAISVIDYCSSIRTDLFKNMVRDIVFEALLKTMSCDASHPEVFSLVVDLCRQIDASPTDLCFPGILWRFFYQFLLVMGVAPSIDSCSRCGKPVHDSGAFLQMESGSATCAACIPPASNRGTFLPASVLRQLYGNNEPANHCLPVSEIRRITRLLARYCQFHFHLVSDFKSLEFLDSILADASVTPVQSYEHETINS